MAKLPKRVQTALANLDPYEYTDAELERIFSGQKRPTIEKQAVKIFRLINGRIREFTTYR